MGRLSAERFNLKMPPIEMLYKVKTIAADEHPDYLYYKLDDTIFDLTDDLKITLKDSFKATSFLQLEDTPEEYQPGFLKVKEDLSGIEFTFPKFTDLLDTPNQLKPSGFLHVTSDGIEFKNHIYKLNFLSTDWVYDGNLQIYKIIKPNAFHSENVDIAVYILEDLTYKRAEVGYEITINEIRLYSIEPFSGKLIVFLLED